MGYKITPKDPHFCYIGNFVWVPEIFVDEKQLRQKLQFTAKGYRPGEVKTIRLWDKCGKHYRLPRKYPLPQGVPVIDLRDRLYPQLPFEDTMKRFLDEEQERAWTEGLEPADEGVFNLACGRGKSALAIKKAVANNGPFVICVDNTGTFPQWETNIRQFTNYRGPIGIIRGSRMDWNHPIVLASYRTLTMRPELPPQIAHRFRTVIFDEGHHLAADVLKTVLPRFWGKRIVLSATAEREDGLEPIIFAHCGPIFYSDLSQPLTPTTYFKTLHTELSMSDPHVLDRSGFTNIGKMTHYLCEMPKRNAELIHITLEAVAAGRKVLVLTHSVKHAKELSEAVAGSKDLTGDTPTDIRLEIFKNYRVVFATIGVAREALDAPDIDTVIFATPFKSWPILQQGSGRATRIREGKRHPVVVILYDVEVRAAAAMCHQLMKKLEAHQMEYRILK
jgi:superfamily II DNA or RNA helicase